MFATKHDAEKWIEQYAAGGELTARKIWGYWRIVTSNSWLSKSEIRQIEELHDLMKDK